MIRTTDRTVLDITIHQPSMTAGGCRLHLAVTEVAGPAGRRREFIAEPAACDFAGKKYARFQNDLSAYGLEVMRATYSGRRTSGG